MDLHETQYETQLRSCIGKLTPTEQIAWGIVLTAEPRTRDWAIAWLSGKDRTPESAEKARLAGWGAPEAAARMAAWVAQAAAWLVWAPQGAEDAVVWALRDVAESDLIPALQHARSILRGEIPSEQYALQKGGARR